MEASLSSIECSSVYLDDNEIITKKVLLEAMLRTPYETRQSTLLRNCTKPKRNFNLFRTCARTASANGMTSSRGGADRWRRL